ncbi:MAG: holo-ACP synthase [Blastocatellia bacterium]|nr:holo-ACP synthase [Blastocatellia bacterium]
MIVGSGIDIIEISRVASAIERNGERFLARVYTQIERDYCEKSKQSSTHYAGRFAAKEAVLKALGTGLSGAIRWVDVEIVPTKDGPPRLNLKAAALERFSEIGAVRSHITISHSRDYAVAMALFESI